ncbi:disease resistance protein RPS2-like isoform X2 [Mangifera indica]|uniref:disease resistance protein RPS2-like isoform X2 n=1 Tax=Mangifera indica TaxID=29780 RepID=UPI001CFA64B9|nr:disease resistance protein RPS2-like isoform X2 [Mangifera indica]
MPRLSGDMELTWCGMNSPAVSHHWKIGRPKRRGRNFDVLLQKTEYLYDMRDSVKREQVKELMHGTNETMKCHRWLNKEIEIEGCVNDMVRLNQENTSVSMFSCMKLPSGDHMNTLDEITCHLENAPLGHHSQALHRAAKTLTSGRIGGETYGQGEKTKNLNQRRKFQGEGELDVEVLAQGKKAAQREEVSSLGELDAEPETMVFTKASHDSAALSPHLIKETLSSPRIESKIYEQKEQNENSIFRKMRRHIPVKPRIINTSPSSFKSMVEALTGVGSTFGLKDEVAPSTSGDEEVLSEKVTTAVTESLPAADKVPISEIEIVTEDTSPMDESDNQQTSVTVSVGNEGMQSIDEVNYTETEDKPKTEIVRRSIERTVLKILRCLSDVMAKKIGVHGIGGIGKTTVLKTLINDPRTKSMFDLIMLVTLSRSWSVRKIQNVVLRQLSLCQEDSEADSQVAERLFQVLSRKKFLLLLDDVWEKLDLEAVGIPDPNLENGCKILMASRKLDVFHDMYVVKVIEMDALSREEAWELFYEQAGRIIALQNIQPFAKAIVEGCGGLPLLIIVTGRALSEENDISVWEHASRKFSLSTVGTYLVEDVIQLLKFSFDQLKDHETKSFFLHCCLFLGDEEVNIFEFIEYCFQEVIITGSWADAHKRGLDIVEFLIHNYLLQLTEGDDSIKMHDLIRDLALSILSVAEGSQYLLPAYSRLTETSNPGNSLSSRSLDSLEGSRLFIPEGHQFLLKPGAGLTEPPSEEEWTQAKMIFLMENELSSLPERPSCPELLTLFLQRNYQLRVIPMSFFDRMNSLEVLNLSNTRIKYLPQSIFKLKSLKIIILRDCERLAVLPSEVGSLKCLEVLDLKGTQISKLPDEVCQLASLRYLEVYFYGSINHNEYANLPRELISTGVMSGLRSLETLSIVMYPGDQRWYKDVQSVIVDISKLTELRSLCFHFPEEELLEIFLEISIAWKAQQLNKFKFVVGHDVKSITSRVPDYLEFEYNRQSRCLRFVNVVDSMELTEPVFPILENLSLHHLWNLTHIWPAVLPEESFARLKILSVQACPKLKYIFSSSLIHFFSNLEELAVKDCPAVEEIICQSEITDSGNSALPSLKKLTLHYLPKLVNIWTKSCTSLEHISFFDCPNFKRIGKDSISKQAITKIKAEKSWWDALEWEDTELRLCLQENFITICEDDL